MRCGPLVAFAATALPFAADAQDRSPLQRGVIESAVSTEVQRQLVEQVQPLRTRIAEQEETIATLQAELDRVKSWAFVPEGAVVAFARPRGCPERGWSELTEAAGRMIIGVGGKYELPFVGGKPRYQTGGSETHTLTNDEMPEHRHNTHVSMRDTYISKIQTKIIDDSTGRGKIETDSENWTDWVFTGEGGDPDYTAGIRSRGRKDEWTESFDSELNGGKRSHNNMPPYIALYFCKKVSE